MRRHFRRLGVKRRGVGRRLLGFLVGGCRVRPAGRGIVRLVRFNCVRLMMDYFFVSFGNETE
jgi:hypothetical protein